MEKLNKITVLTLLGLTTAPVMLNNIEKHLDSHFILTKIAHANTPATDIDSLTETAHTPVYHLETAQGWSNDLQTINWNEKGGYYDIYFLHSVDGATNPFGPSGQDWYHCTTKDFVHFSEQNSAISSNVKNSMSSNDQSWKSAWTGSVVQNQGNIAGVPKGDYVAYFSGLKKADGSQNIWAAWSDDNGRTFSHVLNNGNPVLPYNASFASNDKDNERDAYVCYWNGEMLMYCAEGDKLGVYQSKDGINWSKADPAGASKVLAGTFMKSVNWTDANKPVECPCLKMMTTPDGQTKAVLFYGGKTPQDGQTTGTYYVVGHLDANGLFAAETNAKRLDLGSDYYGSNFSGTDDLNKPNSSIDTMGWVGNWSYTSQGVHNSQNGTGPYTGRLGSYTLPRKLTLNNDLTLSSNIDDSSLHVTNTHIFDNVTKDNPATKDGKLNILGQDADYGPIYTLADIPNLSANSEYDLEFTNSDGYKGRIYIDIWQGADYVKLNFDPTNNNFRVAGKATELNDDLSGTTASSAYYDGMLGKGNGYAEHLDSNVTYPKNFHLKIFTDKDSVEFQFPNGQTYTVARYAINDNQDFKVYTQDPTGNNTMNLVTNTVDILPKSTTKPSDSKPATNTGTTNTTENKPVTGTITTNNNKPATGNTENKPTTTQPTTNNNNKPATNNTNTTYKYSVAYFNNSTGQSMKTAEFTSSDKLSDSDLSSKINSNAPGKVIKYNVDETKKNDDGSTSVDIIALVDTSSSNTTTNKPANDNKPTTNTGNTANTNTEKPSGSKPVTGNTEKPSDNKSSSSGATKDDKPSTNTATTKPNDNKSSSSNTAKNDKPATNTEKPSDSKSSSSSAKNDKPATGNSNKADANTTKPATNTDNKADSNKSSSSTDKTDSDKASTAKPTDNSNKTDNKSDSNTAKPSDSKPATGTETKPDGNKQSAENTHKADTNTVKSSADKTSVNSGKADSNKDNSTENKSDAKSDNKQSTGTTTDKNGVKSSSVKNINATGAKSATSSLSVSSKKSSMKSEINSVKSSSSSVSSKHNDETEINSVKSSSSSISNSEKSSSVKSEDLSETSSMNDNDKKADNISGKSNDVADTESNKVSSLSSSITENKNTVNNNSNNNALFNNQNASGNNATAPETSTMNTTTTLTSPDDDTYSAQKAAMLAKTNAKAERGGIIATIGAIFAIIAGWFGLKKKNE